MRKNNGWWWVTLHKGCSDKNVVKSPRFTPKFSPVVRYKERVVILFYFKLDHLKEPSSKLKPLMDNIFFWTSDLLNWNYPSPNPSIDITETSLNRKVTLSFPLFFYGVLSEIYVWNLVIYLEFFSKCGIHLFMCDRRSTPVTKTMRYTPWSIKLCRSKRNLVLIHLVLSITGFSGGLTSRETLKWMNVILC